MHRIRTFTFKASAHTDDAGSAEQPGEGVELALSRRDAAWLLVHPTIRHADAPNSRQYAVINALVQRDPFPTLSKGGKPRIWLKVGQGKAGQDGGENKDMLENLLTAGVVRDLQTSAQQGAITYPLVEILVPSHEMCNLCAKCGAFETQQEESTERFKRCARCKQVFYCSAHCQTAHWQTHKPNCLDVASDKDADIEEARRRSLLRLFGHGAKVEAGPRSKMD